jgi:hypothetical protein
MTVSVSHPTRVAAAVRPAVCGTPANPRAVQRREDFARAVLACQAVAYALGVEGNLMALTRGSPGAALARQLAMYLTHVGFGISQTRVGHAFGRDRTTIGHACQLIEDKRDDPGFDDIVCALEAMLEHVPPRVSPL